MKKLLVISLVLALVSALILPSVAMAAGPTTFNASGTISGIEDTEIGVNAFPVGQTSKWRVVDRDLYVNFAEGNVTGEFTLTYGGIFNIYTQAGQFHGTLANDDGSVVFNIQGTVAPLEMVSVGPYSLPELTINGQWTYLKGGQGEGQFNAWMIFIPDQYGHVVAVPYSSFSMTGN